MKEYEYECPECGAILYRASTAPEVESACANSGKDVMLRRVE